MRLMLGFLFGLMLGAGSLLAYGFTSWEFSKSWGDCVVDGEVQLREEYDRYVIDVAIHYVECEE